MTSTSTEGVMRAVRLGIVAAMGVAAVAFTWATGIPGAGLFIAGTIAAGFVTALIAPGWAGFGVLMASITLGAIVADTASGHSSLLALIVVSMVVPATLGSIAGYGVNRVGRLGLGPAIRDPRTLAAIGGVLAISMFIAYVAGSFAENPP